MDVFQTDQNQQVAQDAAQNNDDLNDNNASNQQNFQIDTLLQHMPDEYLKMTFMEMEKDAARNQKMSTLPINSMISNVIDPVINSDIFFNDEDYDIAGL